MSLGPPECTPKCRSQQHANQVVAALTSGSEGQLRAFLNSHCHNAATLRDAFGRTALHLAASLGKKAVLEWLLESKSADLMVKDKESSWTAVHRSAFYGQIHCLISLVKVQSLRKLFDVFTVVLYCFMDFNSNCQCDDKSLYIYIYIRNL